MNGGECCHIHGHVHCGDKHDGEQDRARNCALGLANFAAQEAEVVVAPVIVCGDQRGLREATDSEAGGERWRGWHVPPAVSCGLRKAGNDHSGDGRQHTGKQYPREARKRAQISIEQSGNKQARQRGREARVVKRRECGEGGVFKARPEPRQEAGEADASGGD